MLQQEEILAGCVILGPQEARVLAVFCMPGQAALTQTPQRTGTFQMNLRTKLLLGYLMFVAALIVLGGWSAWHLREMGGVSRNIIANNYDSVVAAQGMRESLDRQGSAVLFALLGRPRAGPDTDSPRNGSGSTLTSSAPRITSRSRPKARSSSPSGGIATPITGRWTRFSPR